VIARLRALAIWFRCSCDERFLDVAHDIDCPVHGLAAVLGARR
jgi:hypothetical protein